MPLEFNNSSFQRRFSVCLMISEMIYILRPLVHCYSLKLCTSKSYKPYFSNIIMDFMWILFLILAEGVVSFQNPIIKDRIKN